MASINFHYVDELIQVRQHQHGGRRGAPPIRQGHRTGASINRSCIVMLSAILQAYVEEEFQEAAKRAFPALASDSDAFDRYWSQMKNWGNPSDSNIRNLFMRLGIPNVFDRLSWQGTSTREITKKLDTLNQLRNRIAHGSRSLTVDGQPYRLTLANVSVFRNLAEQFSTRFTPHVNSLVQRRVV